MSMPFLSAFCVLAVLIIGLLVMTQTISLEQVCGGIWRCFLLLVLALVTFCLLKALLLPILTLGLIWLRQLMLWVLVIVLAVVASMLLLRMLFLKLANGNTRGNTNRGKYE